MSQTTLIIKPHWRAFGVWYLAVILFALGPGQNPDAPISGLQGLIIAALIAAAIAFHALTSRLEFSAEGLNKSGGLISRKRQSMAWSDLKEVKLQRGMIHTALGVGVLVFVPKSSKGELIKFWGATEPKKIKARAEEMAGLGPTPPAPGQDES